MSNFKPMQPSNTAYASMLLTLMRDGSNPQDRAWAESKIMELVAELDEKLTDARELGLKWQAEAEMLAEGHD